MTTTKTITITERDGQIVIGSGKRWPNGTTTIVPLASFGRGNLQGIMMITALEVAMSISMADEIEVDLTPEDCERIVKTCRMVQAGGEGRAKLMFACERVVAISKTPAIN